MRGFRALVAARASLFALAVGVPSAPVAALAAAQHHAPSPAAPFAYNTTGMVDVAAAPSSVTGPSQLEFAGVTGATFVPNSGQTIDLGQFVVSHQATPSGQTTRYANTPFEIEIQAPEFDKTTTLPVISSILPKLGRQWRLKSVTENRLLLRGVLNGQVTPAGQANITATVRSIKLGSMAMQTQDHVTHYTFPIRASDLKLPPSWKMAATTRTTLPVPAAEMLVSPPTPTPTPEPSTFVIFAVAVGGLTLARRRASR